jgi:hypothetical protein
MQVLNLPPRIKKLLIGSVVTWRDDDPLSMSDDMLINYYFDTKTNANADLLLRRHGLADVSQFASMSFNWFVEIENIYHMPNRENVEKEHSEFHRFNYRGTIYPMGERFQVVRDAFYIAKNMEFSLVPDDHKNKKFYLHTKFTATVKSI